MEENNYLSEEFKTKEKKFDNFLNKTIVLQSKQYFRNEMRRESKEQFFYDDKNFETFLNEFINDESDEEDIVLNLLLDDAISELSAIEQSVLFLLYKKDLSQEDASRMLEICSTTVSKIKVRAIDKLRKYIEEEF